jgi:hypothetical protein
MDPAAFTSWRTIARIGVELTDIIWEMHTNGSAHTDLHLGNVLQSTSTEVAVVDLGDIVSFKETPNDLAEFKYRAGDLKDILVSLAFLRKGERRFFTSDRFSYPADGSQILRDTPPAYQQAVDLVYSYRESADISYEELRNILRSI